MCYPCSHCGQCKVHLPKDACPFCGAPLKEGERKCARCGAVLPVPPGQSAAAVHESRRDA